MPNLATTLRRNLYRTFAALVLGLLLVWVLLGRGYWSPAGGGIIDTAADMPTTTERTFRLGSWKQITKPGQHGEPIMQLTKLGEGKLILSFSSPLDLLVGAEEVVIDLAWQVDGDEVTFEVLQGVPEQAFNRVFALALEKVTLFSIDTFEPELVILKRVKDGELFEWRYQQAE